MRQMEVAELMIAINKYSITYAKSLVVATLQDQMINSAKRKIIRELIENQIALMEPESTNLDRDYTLTRTKSLCLTQMNPSPLDSRATSIGSATVSSLSTVMRIRNAVRLTSVSAIFARSCRGNADTAPMNG